MAVNAVGAVTRSAENPFCAVGSHILLFRAALHVTAVILRYLTVQMTWGGRGEEGSRESHRKWELEGCARDINQLQLLSPSTSEPLQAHREEPVITHRARPTRCSGHLETRDPFPTRSARQDSPSLRLLRAPQTFGRSCLPRAASRMGSRLLFQTADLFSI